MTPIDPAASVLQETLRELSHVLGALCVMIAGAIAKTEVA